MSYQELLQSLENALEEANILEKNFDSCKKNIKRADKVCTNSEKLGLSFSKKKYAEAEDKFNSGDYVGAEKLATVFADDLEKCNLSYSTTMNLFEMLDTFDMSYTRDSEDLKSEIDDLMYKGNFTETLSFIVKHEGKIRSQLASFEEAKSLVSELNEIIMSSKEHILIEKFVQLICSLYFLSTALAPR